MIPNIENAQGTFEIIPQGVCYKRVICGPTNWVTTKETGRRTNPTLGIVSASPTILYKVECRHVTGIL